MSNEQVRCIKCGVVEEFPFGCLTEYARQKHLCKVCRQVVVERAVEEAEIGDRSLLLD